MRPQRGPFQKRHVVTATIISGGAAGLLLLAPSLANAADPVADLLAQQAPPTTEPTATDDSTAAVDDTTPADETSTDDESTESGRVGRLRELLQPLVDDGTLTAEQADAVVAELQSAERPEIWVDGPMVVHGGPGGQEFPGQGFPGGPGLPGQIEIERPGGPEVSINIGFPFGASTADLVANTIGIDVSDLITQLRDGATIADVATANGVDPQAVIDAVVQDVTDQVAAAVDSGRLTQEEADERLANASERITAFVDGEQPAAPTASGTETSTDESGTVPADTAPADTAADVTETTTSA